MFEQLLSSAYLPFTAAFVVMVGIGLIEAVGLGLGHLDLGADADVDAHWGVLDWLGLGGELPLLIWLTSFLGCFTIAGVAVQQIATGVSGAPIAWLPASGAALLIGGALNTVAANGLVRVMPGFETTAISSDELLCRRGTILEGIARRGSPARAKVIDRFGQAHFVMVEPHEEEAAFRSGETVLLVRRGGKLFFGTKEGDTFLQSI